MNNIKEINFEQLSPKELAHYAVELHPKALALVKLLLSPTNTDPLAGMIGADVEFYLNKILAQKFASNLIKVGSLPSYCGFDAKTFLSLYASHCQASFSAEQITPQWEVRHCELFLSMMELDPTLKSNLQPYMKKFKFDEEKADEKIKALSSLSSRAIMFALLIDTIKTNNLTPNFKAPKEKYSIESAWTQMFEGTVMRDLESHNVASFTLSQLHPYFHHLSSDSYIKHIKLKDVEGKLIVLEHDYFLLELFLEKLNFKNEEFWLAAREILPDFLVDKLEHSSVKKAIEEKKLISNAINEVSSSNQPRDIDLPSNSPKNLIKL